MIRPMLVLLVALWPVAVRAQDLVTPSDRVSTFVNIRATPSEGGADIGDLRITDGLPLLGEVPRWYRVQLSGEESGSSVRRGPPSPEPFSLAKAMNSGSEIST